MITMRRSMRYTAAIAMLLPQSFVVVLSSMVLESVARERIFFWAGLLLFGGISVLYSKGYQTLDQLYAERKAVLKGAPVPPEPVPLSVPEYEADEEQSSEEVVSDQPAGNSEEEQNIVTIR